VEAGEVQVTPAVRGCMYLVARRDVPLALRVADLLSRPRVEREHEKAGVRPGEVEEVGAAVLEVLGALGPLTPEALRRALPAGAVRSLGEAGKKLGISSPLPSALRRLELAGRVERRLEGKRLDSERYLWRVAAVNPFDGSMLPEDPLGPYAGLARIFFRAAGLGTQKAFAGWAGIPQRDAKAALERCALLPALIEGTDEVHYLLEERRDLLDKAEEAAHAVAFLSFEDNLVALHGGPALLIDAEHHTASVAGRGHTRSTVQGEASKISLRSVVAEGGIAGFWEYDPDAGAVVYAAFGSLSKGTRAQLDTAAEGLSQFLTDDLGHGRSFSLDTDNELRTRSRQVREVQSPGPRLANDSSAG
jgi:hypothetical protein